MPCYQRDVYVAAFADGLAVVEAFEHGEQARVFLYVAREGVQIARALMTAEASPARRRCACGGYCLIDIHARGFADLADDFACARD